MKANLSKIVSEGEGTDPNNSQAMHREENTHQDGSPMNDKSDFSGRIHHSKINSDRFTQD